MKTYKIKNRIKQSLYRPKKTSIITNSIIKNIKEVEEILENELSKH